MAYLNLASIRLCTESEGPGKRFAIWVQGCERRCSGCCNPDMQEIRKNIVVDTKDLIELIHRTMLCNQIEGLSFIGGEPILQAEGLSEAARWAHSVGLTVLVFTGYLYDDLKVMDNKSVNKLLVETDLLVDGTFIQEEYDTERDWIGSKNQKIYFLSDAYKPGIEFEKQAHQMEVLISEKDILINGWPYCLGETMDFFDITKRVDGGLMSEVVGDTEEAVLETKRLEGQFIVYYGYPEWNK